jgi:hypothetical protein
MASGGRRSTTWSADNAKPGPGRPKGSPDKVPRALKASIRRVIEEIASDDPELIRAAVRAGLSAPPPKSFPYLQLAAFYVDGKPVEDVKLHVEQSITRIVQVFADGTSDTIEIGPAGAFKDSPTEELDASPGFKLYPDGRHEEIFNGPGRQRGKGLSRVREGALC